MDYQDQAVLKFSLCVPDVHWISLRPEVEGLIVPSKVYGIAAAGRPVIAICAKNGEISKMVEQYQCGVVVEPGNVGALVDSILQLSNDMALRAKMGATSSSNAGSQFYPSTGAGAVAGFTPKYRTTALTRLGGE